MEMYNSKDGGSTTLNLIDNLPTNLRWTIGANIVQYMQGCRFQELVRKWFEGEIQMFTICYDFVGSYNFKN